jgi:hypothetical protein
MTQRETATPRATPSATRRTSHGRVTRGRLTRGLALAALLLPAFSTADAQTSAPAAGGPSAPIIEKVDVATAAVGKAAAESGNTAAAGAAAAGAAAAAAAQAPTQTTVAAESRPDGFAVGGFTFKPGGRVKLDIIRDFDPIGSEDSFDPRTIPTDDSEGGNSNIHAKETRLSLDIRGPVTPDLKELRMFVEMDFYGSSSVLRLRHAYGSFGGLLAGQTWSTFVDDANFPNTIDFEAPMAHPSVRQAQLRWTSKLSEKVTWSAAVEDNKSTITPPAGVPGKAEYPMPDLATRVKFEASRGHAFASVFLGKARFRPEDGDPTDATLWGMLLSGRVKTFGSDYVYGTLTFGDGVGRYRGGVTAVPDANGELHAPGLVAVMGGYEHFWNARLSSNAVFSNASSDEEDFYADSGNEQLDYAAINLLYWFLPNRAWAGVEYLHGGREVFGGQDGSANRLQFAVRFNLP